MSIDRAFAPAGKRIWIAGHRGMVGSALARRLQRENCEILTASSSELDLRDQAATRAWVVRNKPDAVLIAAAKVGGISANDSYPADFLYENMMIEANAIEASFRADVEKLVFLGSSCIYPKSAHQPITEDALLTGPLEPTNEWYAVAKIAGIKLCQAYRRQYGVDYISAMPTNLYGPGDNFDLASSHVIPALMRKIHDAKVKKKPEVVMWGTGTPRREFLHADDCADAVVHLLKAYSDDIHVNVGSGKDITIRELTELLVDIVGFDGGIVQDLSKPDGMPRKLISADKLKSLGWTPRVGLREGLVSTYQWYVENVAEAASFPA